MSDDWSREDLTGEWLGEIGRQLLVVATELRKGKRPLSSFLSVRNLQRDCSKIISRLSSLKDSDKLELLILQDLCLLKRDIEIFYDHKTSPEIVAEKLESFGKYYYCDYGFDTEPPSDLLGISGELRKLIDLIQVYGPQSILAIPMAEWIAFGITRLSQNNDHRLSHEVLSLIQNRVLATSTFLNDMSSRNRADCIRYLSETADFLKDHGEPERHLECKKRAEKEQEHKAKPVEKRPELNDTEQNVIEAVGEDTLIAEELAKKAGYPCNSNFKSTLSSLRKRGILDNKFPKGYFLRTEYHFLLRTLDESQD